MLIRLPKFSKVLVGLRTLSDLTVSQASKSSLEIIDTRDINLNKEFDLKVPGKSVLEDCAEDISHVASYLKPAFNFAAYANKSELLQKFINLGVDLHKLEKKPNIFEYLLKLNFEKDVQNHLLYLSDLGVSTDQLGQYLTKNPFIFQEDLDSLVVRINYLKSKKFTNEMITRIITKNPYWLLFSTQRIDRKLGFFQKHFTLKGHEVRSLATRSPKIITYSINHIKVNTFVVKEEMGFNDVETKQILLNKPDVFMKRQENMLKTFQFVHTNMKIPLERIVEFPGVLTCRLYKIKQRHQFLKQLKKDQYDANQPNYVSLSALVSATDVEFCSGIAKCSIQAFNTFLKSE